ncbi:MAG: hypothetical protein H7X83_10070 [Verrucomicrobia bacterium]|nr:hypothetical protein [Deltaproteobacteria bacterium]
MGALSHYLEEEGLATTQISLIREHTEIMKPPRALWVPFELGRPFGVPGNATFQTRVVVSALELLEVPEGPVLADFPDDAPDSAAPATSLACPVNFASPMGDMTTTDQLLEAFRNEAADLNNWYDLALRKRERTTAGITGLSLTEIVEFFVSFIGGSRGVSPLVDVPVATALRLSTEDLKAMYFEGIVAQPGVPGDSAYLANWFWGETVAARTINVIREICLELPDNDFQLLGKLLLVPRTQLHRFREREG